MAQEFNFHVPHLRYTGLISLIFNELTDFLILQKAVPNFVAV